MLNRNAERIDRIVRESLLQTKNRAIILSGWSEIPHASSTEFLYLDAVPHQWLLPRCKMVIHHGGAGTTSAGLRAGIPNIVIPFIADQPFWGRRVQAIGAGPQPIPAKEISTQKLIQAIIACETDTIHKSAQVIGQDLKGEDGIHKSIEFIERYSDEFHKN